MGKLENPQYLIINILLYKYQYYKYNINNFNQKLTHWKIHDFMEKQHVLYDFIYLQKIINKLYSLYIIQFYNIIKKKQNIWSDQIILFTVYSLFTFLNNKIISFINIYKFFDPKI